MPTGQNPTDPEIKMTITCFQKPQHDFAKRLKGFTFSSKIRLKRFLLLEILENFDNAVAFTDGISGSSYIDNVSQSL